MLFIEAQFFLFFAVVFGIYWKIKSVRSRLLLLLSASYVFYSAWDIRFSFLILLSTLIDYSAAIYIERFKHKGQNAKAKLIMLCSVIINLGILGFFKYFNFFAESLSALANLFGLGVDTITLEIILPLGISFYTFQTMSYSIDVYKGKITAEKDFLTVATYVAFFPQLVAGPIVRAGQLIPQFHQKVKFEDVAFKFALVLIVMGFFKKAVLADTIGYILEPIWENPDEYNSPTLIFNQMLFYTQLLCDFSGYSDMAVGMAMLLGINIPRNFNNPHLARNIADFWSRWHITMTRWFTDYVFANLPKGKNRYRGTLRNLVITMSLVGLWHGASLKFILWGAINGISIAGYYLIRSKKAVQRIPQALAITITYVYCVIVLVPTFRAESIDRVISYYGYMVSNIYGRTLPLTVYIGFLTLVFFWAIWIRYNLESRISSLPDRTFSFILGPAFALILSATPRHYEPFIYFVF